MPDWLPRAGGERVRWTGQLAGALSGDPGAYRIDPAVAAAYAKLQREVATAFSVYQSPSGRSPAMRVRKDEIMARLVESTRSLVRQIRSNPAVDDAAWSRIGLRRSSRRRRKLPPPRHAPSVSMCWRPDRRVDVVLRDVTRPTGAGGRGGRGLPRGVDRARVDVYRPVQPGLFGTGVVGDEWHMVNIVQRARFTIPVERGLAMGQTVQYRVCWMSPTGEPGPWTESTVVAGYQVLEGTSNAPIAA